LMNIQILGPLVENLGIGLHLFRLQLGIR
jgi:hypothetical protein